MKIKSYASNGPGTDSTFRPQLTSLIDVMTILLVFLIKSFSAEGNLLTPDESVSLPVSAQNKHPEVVPTVVVSREHVLWNDTVVTNVHQVINLDSLTIDPLYDRLAALGHVETGNGKILIQADRSLAFHTIKKVIYTCSKAGCRHFSILVVEEG